jgi:hypothetical protein
MASRVEAAAAGDELFSSVEAGVVGVEEPGAAADAGGGRCEASKSVGGGGNEDGSFGPLLDFGPGAVRRASFSGEVSLAQVRSSI